MKKNFPIIIVVFLSISIAYSKDISQVDCYKKMDVNPEISKLFSLIKNSVLGTVPKFCRKDAVDQLNDQENTASQELAKFVDDLKKKSAGETDTVLINKFSDTKKDMVVLNIFKMIILKKYWLNLLLLDTLCNAIIMSDESIYKNNIYSNNGVESYEPHNVNEFSNWLKDLYKNKRKPSDTDVLSLEEQKKLSSEKIDLIKFKQYFGGNLYDALKRDYQDRATVKKNISKLSPDEKADIFDYSRNSYVSINYCLRNANCNDGLKIKIKNILAGMEKIKNSKNDDSHDLTLFRGGNLPQALISELAKEPKGFLLDKGFMSTSGSVHTANVFGENLLILKAKSCVGIANISDQGEDEFLCPPNLKFNVRKLPGREGTYVVEEVD